MTPPYDEQPPPFLSARIHRLDIAPSLTGLCAGYERGEWRAAQFADHVMKWLPEFALTASEYEAIRGVNAVDSLRLAAKLVYESDKYQKRGEFGELILHIAIRQVFQSLPAISKIYYKTARNETVKGFDAVHVVGNDDDLELWLGEVKFYSDVTSAIREVVSELRDHLSTDYLRSEFMLIINKIDDSWPHAKALRKLLSPDTSLDQVFRRACVPILLTYDSSSLASHSLCADGCPDDLLEELKRHHADFTSRSRTLPREVRLHLFLLPLNTKEVLIQVLHERLRAWQAI